MINKNFTAFPILVTNRFTLRALYSDDAQDIFTLRSDKEINKYLDRQACKKIEEAQNFINKISEGIVNNESLYWVITLTASKTFVGTICLYDFSNDNANCEMGYELLTNFQGQGIMREAAAKVIEYAFQTLRIQRIDAYTHRENMQSTKLLENLNFKKSLEADEENPHMAMFTLQNKILPEL